MRKFLLLLGILCVLNIYAEGEDEFYALQTESVRLEESVISTTGFETSIKNTPNNVIVITKKEIESKNYTSVEQTLRDVPGVDIKENSLGLAIDIRGQGGFSKGRANVQVLVDGVSLNPLDNGHGTLPLNAVEINSVEAIEIIPGGGAILYGGGTSGGVVNIITKSKNGITANNSINFRRGSYGETKIGASAGYVFNDKLLIQTSYSGLDKNGYRSDTETKSNYFDVLGKYKISPRQTLSLKYARYGEETSGETEYLTREQLNDDRNQSGANKDTKEGDLTRDEVFLDYDFDINDRLELTLDISYQKTENNIKKTDSKYDPYDADYMERKFAIKPKLKVKYGKNNDIIFGYDYIDSSHEKESYKVKKSTGSVSTDNRYMFRKETHSGFALNTYRFDKLELIQGYRYEYAKYNPRKQDFKKETTSYDGSETMNNNAYELAANYLYSDSGNAYVRWEQGYTSPAPNQLISNETGNKYEINDLDSETYNTYELGVRDYVLGSYVSSTVFYTIKDDEILFDNMGDSDRYSYAYINLEETTRKGIEISAEQALGKLIFKESYSYIDAKITAGENDGNYIPNVAKNTASISSRYDFTHKFNTILTVNYRDRQYLNEENVGGKVNDYITVDLTVNYTLENGLRLFAGINNLLDEDYYNDVEYDKGEYTYDPALERNFYVGFNCNF